MWCPCTGCDYNDRSFCKIESDVLVEEVSKTIPLYSFECSSAAFGGVKGGFAEMYDSDLPKVLKEKTMGVSYAHAYEIYENELKERQMKKAEKRKKKQALDESTSFDPFDYGLSVKRDDTSDYAKAFEILKDRFGEDSMMEWKPEVLERALTQTILTEVIPQSDHDSEVGVRLSQKLMGGFDVSSVGVDFNGPSFVNLIASARKQRAQTHLLWKLNVRRKR